MEWKGYKSGPKKWKPGPYGDYSRPYVEQFERELLNDGYEITWHKDSTHKVEYKIKKDGVEIPYTLWFEYETAKTPYDFDVPTYVSSVVRNVKQLHGVAKSISGGKNE